VLVVVQVGDRLGGHQFHILRYKQTTTTTTT
jgi:hypothetical protein